jgi:hypothetical protein
VHDARGIQLAHEHRGERSLTDEVTRRRGATTGVCTETDRRTRRLLRPQRGRLLRNRAITRPGGLLRPRPRRLLRPDPRRTTPTPTVRFRAARRHGPSRAAADIFEERSASEDILSSPSLSPVGASTASCRPFRRSRPSECDDKPAASARVAEMIPDQDAKRGPLQKKPSARPRAKAGETDGTIKDSVM